MHKVMPASGGEAAQHRDAVQGITHPDARSRQSLPLRWVDGYSTLGPLRAQLGTWGPLVYPQQSRPTWTSARCWRRPTGQGWPPCWDITSSRNVSSRWLVFYMWPVKCTVVIILLLLWADQVFRCYCEQTLFSFATVSKLYCFFEILLSFWKHFLFLRETLQILILLASLSYQLVWVKIRFFILEIIALLLCRLIYFVLKLLFHFENNYFIW